MKDRQMKLLELLVKELEEWPEGVTYFVQDGDGEVKAGSGSELSEPTDSCVWIRHIPLDDYIFYSCLCTDWQTSIVTKDIYTKHKERYKAREQRDKLANPVQVFDKDTKTSVLVWSNEHEANESIRYNHVLADSPLGKFSIEWKGWKDHDSYCIYVDGYYLDYANNLDEAKLIAEKRLVDKAHELFE